MKDSLHIITKGQKGYPDNLRDLSDMPGKLYVNGKLLKKDSFAMAIVGTRRPTEYGKRVAKKFGYSLAKAGITIISGLALGIDTIAHESALRAGGRTIAVLAGGLDNIYPPENKGLAEAVVKKGALVSEFPLGTKAFPKNFLIRNRLISGLSLGVLVVEGARRSGTLSTATWAANQGREVFAIPGNLDSVMSEMPNFLINEGAVIARSPKDVLEFLVTKIDTI